MPVVSVNFQSQKRQRHLTDLFLHSHAKAFQKKIRMKGQILLG